MKHRAACLLILTFLMCMIFTGTAYASDSVPPENDVLKIGISMKSSTDAFCKSCKSVLDLAGQALDVKFEYIYCGETPEGVLTSVEQLAVIGVKGIVLCGVNEEALGDVIDLCNKKKIYMAMAFDTVTKEDNKDLYKKAQKSKFVIGAVHGEESESGAAAAPLAAPAARRRRQLRDAASLGRLAPAPCSAADRPAGLALRDA